MYASHVYIFKNNCNDCSGYFFTYFSQFQLDNTNDYDSYQIFEIFVLSLIFLSANTLNMCLGICTLSKQMTRTITNYCVVNITVADVVLIFTIPPIVFVRIVEDWLLGRFLCKLIPFIQSISLAVIMWSISVISVERYFRLKLCNYNFHLSGRRAILGSSVMWMLAIIIFAPLLFYFEEISVPVQNAKNRTFCSLHFPQLTNFSPDLWFLVSILTFVCLLPITILTYNYQQISKKLIIRIVHKYSTLCRKTVPKKPKPDIEENVSQVVINIFLPISKYRQHYEVLTPVQCAKLQKLVRIVRLLLVNICMVLILWIPLISALVLIYIDSRRDFDDTNFFVTSRIFIGCLTIAYVNALVNPVLYGVTSVTFHTHFTQCWKNRMWFYNLCSKRKNNSDLSGNKFDDSPPETSQP